MSKALEKLFIANYEIVNPSRENSQHEFMRLRFEATKLLILKILNNELDEKIN